MNIKTVDLYEYYGIPAPEGAKGQLTCLADTTSPEVSSSRVRPAVLVLPGGGYWFTSDREATPVAPRLDTSCIPACW